MTCLHYLFELGPLALCSVAGYAIGVLSGWKRHALVASSLVQDMSLKSEYASARNALDKAAALVLRVPIKQRTNERG